MYTSHDTFLLSVGSGVDTVSDFSTEDALGLAGGIQLSDIVVTVSNGDSLIYANSELLAILSDYTNTLVAGDDYIIYELM